MRFSVDRHCLIKMIGKVAAVADKKTQIPILATTLLTVETGQLRATATDMEVTVSDGCAAEVMATGTAAVNAAVLADIVRKLPDKATVTFERDDEENQLTVTSGRYRTRLVCAPADDFPPPASSGYSESFHLPTADMRRLIDRTRAAISTDEARYYLNGMFLQRYDGPAGPTLRSVATDGHRLAIADVRFPTEASEDFPPVIVPRKTVGEILKLLNDDEPEITVRVSETRVRIESGRSWIESKLIDGTFPDYGRVIPIRTDAPIQVDHAELEVVLSRVAAVSHEKTRAVALTVRAGTLHVSLVDHATGSAREEVDHTKTDLTRVGDLNVGFQARYVHDVLDQIQGMAMLHVKDPTTAVLVEDDKQPDCQFILMPIRVPELTD